MIKIFKIIFFTTTITVLFSCTMKKTDTLNLEIQSVENGLMPLNQIKGEDAVTFNILDRMKHYKVPGVSIALVENGQLKWAKGYGIANTDTNKAVDTNTLFQAGSISKPLAALSALHLVQQGKLDLDTNVNEYLLDWKLPENEFTISEKVTLRRLLTHTAGITVHGFPGYNQTDKFPTISQVLDGEGNTSKIELDTIPGSIWRYSGGGYTVMEKIVEDTSQLSLDAYMHKFILPQLGMHKSTFEQPIDKEHYSNLSAAYNYQGNIVKGLWHNYPEQAAAGLWTTATDLAQYAIEIYKIYNGKKNSILTKETVNAMLTKHKGDWGLGPALK